MNKNAVRLATVRKSGGVNSINYKECFSKKLIKLKEMSDKMIDSEFNNAQKTLTSHHSHLTSQLVGAIINRPCNNKLVVNSGISLISLIITIIVIIILATIVIFTRT